MKSGFSVSIKVILAIAVIQVTCYNVFFFQNLKNTSGLKQCERPGIITVRRAMLNESFLAYMHIAKTGGTSFSHMLTKEPLSLLPVAINCGYFKGCCDDSRFHKSFDKVLDECPHISYEATWPIFEKILQKKTNALLLTHLRSPTWHVLSMLGHDLSKERFGSYGKKLAWNSNSSGGYSSRGYPLSNMVHVHRFKTTDTSFIFHLLEEKFFWFGITDHMEASMCLLFWQLHIFDWYDSCRSLCGDSGQVINNVTNNVVVKIGVANETNEAQTLSQAQLKHIASITKLDQALYEIAVNLFYQRSAVAEMDLGFRFLNCHLSL